LPSPHYRCCPLAKRWIAGQCWHLADTLPPGTNNWVGGGFGRLPAFGLQGCSSAFAAVGCLLNFGQQSGSKLPLGHTSRRPAASDSGEYVLPTLCARSAYSLAAKSRSPS